MSYPCCCHPLPRACDKLFMVPLSRCSPYCLSRASFNSCVCVCCPHVWFLFECLFMMQCSGAVSAIDDLTSLGVWIWGFFCSKPYSFIVLFRDARPALAVLRVLFSTCSSLNAHIHTDDQKRGAGDRKQVLYFSHVSLELRTVDCGCVYFADETVMAKEQNQGGR